MKMRRYCVVVFVGCFVCIHLSHACVSSQKYLNFDHLYPPSCYEQVLNKIMCFWANIRKTKTDYQRNDIVLVACLMRLSQLYKDVISYESESICSESDSAYLHQLMNRLFISCYRLMLAPCVGQSMSRSTY